MSIYFERNHQRAFGTFPLKGDALVQALGTALRIGYRAIDTAQAYDNEAEVGEALQASGIERSELCVTTKVDIQNFAPERFLPSVEASLQRLRLDHVDVLLVHWPPQDGDIAPPLRLLEQAVRRGYATHIGVSNYTAAMMERARTAIDMPLVTNQVEFHPLLDQRTLLSAATRTGIPLSSYCSLARGEVFKHGLFADIGAAYGKTASQVVLRWILQKGVTVNTMSTRPENIEANFQVMDFTLSSIDMDRIETLTRLGHRIVDAARVPWAPAWD